MSNEVKSVRYNDKGDKCLLIPNSGGVYYITNYGECYRYRTTSDMIRMHPQFRGTCYILIMSVKHIKKRTQKIDSLLANTWGISYARQYLNNAGLNKTGLYDSEINQILIKRSKGVSVRELSEQYGITQQSISYLLKNKTIK